jgi:putative redox protein
MSVAEQAGFSNNRGHHLAGRLNGTAGAVRSYALFAHCFTCSKDPVAARSIAAELATRGIAVLRFDFTGLGASEGDFADTNFSSNVDDLRSAATYLAEHHGPAELLIGHSLGGAAVLAAAGDLPDVKAVVTIGAPSSAAQVLASFGASVPTIEREGDAQVVLAGRPFTIRRQFLDDIRGQNLLAKVRDLHRPLLVMHAPTDDVVGIENAREIFDAARHPKSFLSLEGADHLLTRREDARFVAEVMRAWCERYLSA